MRLIIQISFISIAAVEGVLMRPRAAARESAAAPPALFQNVKEGSTAIDNSSALDDVCDITAIGGPVCFSDQLGVLLPLAKAHGLVGHWSFDEEIPLDSSGNGHHAATELKHGPSPAGHGNSAIFKGTSFATISSSVLMQLSGAFSYTVWVYFAEEEDGVAAAGTTQWCPLLRKGVFVPTSREFSNAPALLYSPESGQLRVSVSTTTHTEAEEGEFVDSTARLGLNRWIHLAVVHHNSKLLLYVNGILDAVNTLSGSVVPNDWPLYVGGDPFTSEHCSHTVFLDELKIYSRAVAPHELQADATLALGGTDPAFVHLGCQSCSLSEASNSCPSSRHLCTSLELHTGAYQVARSLGWMVAGAHVWTAASLNGQAGASLALSGLGLCCAGPP